jgi:large subunit ribosomal protein L22
MENTKISTVKGNNVGISTKQSVEICRFLKNKKIEQAINELEEVVKMKRAVPMRGEFPHRKGISGGGRYPVKAAAIFIKLLRSLEANANAKNLDTANLIIMAKADKASRPQKSGKFSGRRFKRTHITIIAK